MNAPFRVNKLASKISFSLLWKAAVLVLAFVLIAARPGPVNPPQDFASVFVGGCQSLPGSANCSYIARHLTGATVFESVGASVILPDCQMLTYCGYLWSHASDGVLVVIEKKLAEPLSPPAVMPGAQDLPLSANWAYIQMHLTGATAAAQISSPAFQPDCQSQTICGYIQMHNRP